MPPDPNSPAAPLHDPSSLLEHVGWVRELAQRLVRDSHVADDLTQETMLAAIENRGTEARSPRAWLSRVLRNVMWERVRQGHRRQAREQAVAKQDVTASSAELVEKVDTHRTLVDAVLRLPEHYRIILLRRYFEGETPTQIATALDMPISTVKTRLQRGLERMRAELDEAYGNRERWQPALLGLIGMPRRSAVLPLPILVAASLLLTCVGAAAWSAWGDPAIAPTPPMSGSSAIVTPSAQQQPPGNTTLARTPAPSQNAIAVDWGAIKMPKQPVRGITVSPEGKPVGGVFLQFEPDRPSSRGGTAVAISQLDGTFEMTVHRSGRIVATPGELATVSPAIVTIASKEELRVVVTAAKELVGTVEDEHGNLLAHAEVLIAEPPAMRGLLGANASTAEMSLQEVITDASGTFTFAAAPLSQGSRIVVRREGYVDKQIAWSGQARLDVTMQRSPATEHEIRGVVHSEHGYPVADIRVSLGTTVTRTDHAGSFRLPLPQLPAGIDAATLVAVAPGYAAMVRSRGLDEMRRPQWPQDLPLTLHKVAARIAGKVLRADGSPAAGARVWLEQPTLFSHRPGNSMTTSIFSSKESASRKFWPETIEALLSTTGEPSAIKADADGKFVLDGLCRRSYTLVAYDCATSLRSHPVTASVDDESVVIQLQGNVIEKVQGVVVDEHDKPVAGVSVALWADLVNLSWGERSIFSQNHVRGAMRTGPDGSFWLYDVPTVGVELYFDGAGIVPMKHEVSAGPLRIVARHSSLMTVTCADHEAVDSVGALDKDGAPVMLRFRRGNSTSRRPRAKMMQGSAETFALPDQAVVIVGYKGDSETRRTAVQSNMRTITW